MANKLWTVHFTRICVANFLLFMSLYMLLPIIPTMMAARLNAPIEQTGILFMLSTLGMFLVGPFYSYLVDAYKRKHVCVLSFLMMCVATLGYDVVENVTQLWLLALIQGIFFGMATTAGITLVIDITNTTLRSAGNVAFAWVARMGMMAGIALGVWLPQYSDFSSLLYTAVGIGLAGIFIASSIHVPFRAPIGATLCSCDRFLLPLGWLPAINLMLVAFIPGVLLPTLSNASDTIRIQDVPVPFYAITLVGFIIAALIARFMNRENNAFARMVTGLALMIASTVQLLMVGEAGNLLAALLLGAGIGLVTPEFLMIFVKLSQHCQRGTANTTQLLAWEIGISAGIAAACALSASNPPEVLFQTALFSGVLALLLFVWVTTPYFKRKRVR